MRKRDIDKVASLAERTADAFESGSISWGQGAFYSEEIDGRRTYMFEKKPLTSPQTGQYCMVGGLLATSLGSHEAFLKYAASSNSVSRWLMPTYVHQVYKLIGIKQGQEAYAWNDEGDRTVEEVIDTLKQVAKDLRNGALGDGGSAAGPRPDPEV